MRYSYTNNEGVSPVIGVILMVAITVILSGVILVGVGAIGNSTNENAAAGYSVNYDSDSQMTVQLNNIERADKVEVVSAFGTRYELNKPGDSQAILNTDSGQTPVVVGTLEGKETVLGEVQPRSFSADIVVAKDGSQDYTDIQTAINNSSAGDIIVLTRDTYEVSSIDINNDVTLVAEHGTTISDTSADSIPTVTLSAEGATISNVAVNVNSNESTGVYSTQDNVSVLSVDVSNATGSDTEITGLNTTVSDSERLVSGSTTVSSTEIPEAPTEGLFVHYPFEENPNDVSGNGLDATNTSATLDSTGGHDGTGAYEFDGSKMTAGFEMEDIGGDYTISIWLRPDDLSRGQTIFGTRSEYTKTSDGHERQLALSLRDTGRIVYTAYSDRTGETASVLSEPVSSQWIHVVVSYDTGDGYVLYKNGQQVDTESNTYNAPQEYTLNEGIGYINEKDYSGNRFDGGISNIRVYNRELSSQEVSDLYQATK